ncbi:hypothetical protein FGG08_002775 [Glutinoglossum americanum]|uniref:Glucosidase 2 subunit beta n=1 Tax=Glutinoglossum americanum TaxID=1670608 RepID=A0A9P8IAX3_9PEZI|nr:hypothetical protein FGG08_002775 [Glutinoglossum americanum]
MRKLNTFLLIGTAVGSVIVAESTGPRGVGPEFAKFYKSDGTFTCISNPSHHINFSQINDDYCDCPDGSDEPGTSACAHLSALSPSSPEERSPLALPGFYCNNKGHRPGYIPFTYVNDGVCDYDLCCDGSDEWESAGGIVCENKCKEIGKEWRKQDEQRKKALRSGQKARKELVRQSSRLRKEIEDGIGVLQIEIRTLELKVGDQERQLADVERSEKARLVKGPAKGGRISVLANLAKGRIEELRTALIDVRSQRDTALERVQELEAILYKFQEEYNPNFNDEGVKRAVRSWEEFVVRKNANPDVDRAAQDRDLDEISKPDDKENGIRWEEWEGEELGDTDVLYKFEEYLPKPLRTWIDNKLRDLRVFMVQNGLLADAHHSSTSDSKAVTQAREALDAARNDVNSRKSQLTNHQEDLTKDYGVDDVFRALKGQCFSKDSGEYIYELCWLGGVTQKPKKGGANTGLGNFVSIDKIFVDDEIPSDGKGLGSGDHVALRYEGGNHCWNGPSRSTLVVLGCAEKDEIWKVMEQEKCVYRMEVGTPAVCDSADEEKPRGKDEL